MRNVPDEIHAALLQHAEARHQSLQQYLAEQLARLAERPDIDVVLDRVEQRRGVAIGPGEAAEVLRDLREGR